MSALVTHLPRPGADGTLYQAFRPLLKGGGSRNAADGGLSPGWTPDPGQTQGLPLQKPDVFNYTLRTTHYTLGCKADHGGLSPSRRGMSRSDRGSATRLTGVCPPGFGNIFSKVQSIYTFFLFSQIIVDIRAALGFIL